MTSYASPPPSTPPPAPASASFARLLVPLDGSELAEEALPVAIALAQRAGTSGTILLAQIRRITPILYSVGNQFDVRPENLSESDAYLAEMGEASLAQGVPAEVLKTQGDAALGIVDLAEEHYADLILLVTHAREGLSRLVHGSVTERVLHAAKMPVLLLKHGEPSSRVFAPGQSPHLLVPLDGSALAESVLPLASALARLVGAPVTLVRSLDMSDLTLTERGRAGAATAAISASIPAERQEAEQYLEQIQHRLQVQGLAATSLVTEGGAAQDIAAQAKTLEEAGQAVLIVLATHGRSGLGRWLYGSVAGAVLHLADVPLLVLRPTSREGASGSESLAPDH